MSKKYDIIADLRRSFDEDSSAFKVFYEEIESSPDIYKMVTEKILELKNILATDNNYLAKALASYIRYNIEDFHHKYLSDEMMRELNPLIRNAIFTMLEDLKENRYLKISTHISLNMPDYWEDCEYISI